MTENELHWVAGLLEGEGSFGMNTSNRRYRYPRIQVNMTDEDIIHRLHETVGVGRLHIRTYQGERSHWKPAYCWSVVGKDAAALMEKILPLMGQRRQARIREVLAESSLQSVAVV